MQPNSQHIGDAFAIITMEIVAALDPASDAACVALEKIGGRLLDTIRALEPGPARDIIKAAAEVLVQSEV